MKVLFSGNCTFLRYFCTKFTYMRYIYRWRIFREQAPTQRKETMVTTTACRVWSQFFMLPGQTSRKTIKQNLSKMLTFILWSVNFSAYHLLQITEAWHVFEISLFAEVHRVAEISIRTQFWCSLCFLCLHCFIDRHFIGLHCRDLLHILHYRRYHHSNCHFWKKHHYWILNDVHK